MFLLALDHLFFDFFPESLKPNCLISFFYLLMVLDFCQLGSTLHSLPCLFSSYALWMVSRIQVKLNSLFYLLSYSPMFLFCCLSGFLYVNFEKLMKLGVEKLELHQLPLFETACFFHYTRQSQAPFLGHIMFHNKTPHCLIITTVLMWRRNDNNGGGFSVRLMSRFSISVCDCILLLFCSCFRWEK